MIVASSFPLHFQKVWLRWFPGSSSWWQDPGWALLIGAVMSMPWRVCLVWWTNGTIIEKDSSLAAVAWANDDVSESNKRMGVVSALHAMTEHQKVDWAHNNLEEGIRKRAVLFCLSRCLCPSPFPSAELLVRLDGPITVAGRHVLLLQTAMYEAYI